MSVVLAFVFAAAVPVAPATAQPVPKKIQRMLAKTDGPTAQSAIRVSSVRQEYQILQALRLKPKSQTLVAMNRKHYDRITTVDDAGNERDMWFDISSFYLRF